MNPARRELVVAVLITVIGAALVLLAVSRPWATATVAVPGLPISHASLSGRDVAPLVAALGLVGLAGAVALVATRGVGRVVVGVLLALAGAGVIGGTVAVSVSSVRSSSSLADDLGAVPASAVRGAAISLTAWRHVAAVGGICLVGAGLLVAARGRRWATMGSRYDAPVATVAATSTSTSTSTPTSPAMEPASHATATAAPPADDASVATDTDVTDKDSAVLWDRLDRGEDPTA